MSVAGVWAVVVAAGRGLRMGGGVPKVLIPLLGRPVLWWALSALERCAAVDAVCLSASPEVSGAAAEWGFLKLARFAPGGPVRGASVLAGLEALPGNAEWAVIHDGARPCVTPEIISAAIEAARETGGSAAATPVRDTIQQVDASLRVVRTPCRETLWAVQTPQVFKAPAILDAYRRAAAEGFEGTDDIEVARRAGMEVRLMPGDPGNIKITVPEDLREAGRILSSGREAAPGTVRIGMGIDTHRLAEGRALILGGVRIPFEKGLLGHSDADALAHAVMDALLGAAALGDIGRHFPDTDERYRGADSLQLLRCVCGKLREAGFRPANVDAVVIAQRPRLSGFIDGMRANLAAAMGLPPENVGVQASTSEGLGPEGGGECITAHAVAAILPFSDR